MITGWLIFTGFCFLIGFIAYCNINIKKTNDKYKIEHRQSVTDDEFEKIIEEAAKQKSKTIFRQ